MSALPDSPLFLLLPQPASDFVTEFDLPERDDNLFQRLIRNPHIDAINPRERECTEMLCAVLRNTTELRLHLMHWMADISGTRGVRFQDITYVIETECTIGAKRDDLRIEGWRETDEGRERVFLWTVEVKVGATFHESSPLDTMQILDEDVGLVNQVVNYDHWLEHQAVPNRTGFVLALEDMSGSLPKNLNCGWYCLSWTKLGLKIKDVLQNRKLPSEDKLLGKHLLGFITDHLWRVSEMTDFEINFDDVSLMRAFGVVGRDSEDKINRLVESLIQMLEKSGVGEGDIYHQKSLYKGMKRSVVYRTLFVKGHITNPTLMAGCTLTHMAIWLETIPGNENKAIVMSVMQSLLPALKERNPGWRVSEEQGWIDLELVNPLAILLAANDQVAEFENYFRSALEDLREVRVFETLRDRLSLELSEQA
jgi:hypothetical protein